MQQPIKFCKMHGLGNDFIVIDGITQSVSIDKISIPKIADRHRGIGFDQLLLIQPSKDADFSCRIFNSDGSEAEQCGNGMRCIARFIQEEQLSDKKTLTIETKAGVMEATIHDFENISVNMGLPKLETARDISIDQQTLRLDILSLGNPHAILQVNSAKDSPVTELGPKISTHTSFPHGTNVGFMEIVNRNHIRLRTFERGAGETFACGSNSCAAVVAGIANHSLDPKVKVELKLGNLWIEWNGKNSPVMMTGPAEKVFSGLF